MIGNKLVKLWCLYARRLLHMTALVPATMARGYQVRKVRTKVHHNKILPVLWGLDLMRFKRVSEAC